MSGDGCGGPTFGEHGLASGGDFCRERSRTVRGWGGGFLVGGCVVTCDGRGYNVRHLTWMTKITTNTTTDKWQHRQASIEVTVVFFLVLLVQRTKMVKDGHVVRAPTSTLRSLLTRLTLFWFWSFGGGLSYFFLLISFAFVCGLVKLSRLFCTQLFVVHIGDQVFARVFVPACFTADFGFGSPPLVRVLRESAVMLTRFTTHRTLGHHTVHCHRRTR